MPTQPYPTSEVRPQHHSESNISQGETDFTDTITQDIKDKKTSSKKKFDAQVQLLLSFIEQKGDISELLDDYEIQNFGSDAISQWELDRGSLAKWHETAKHGLELASQEQKPDGTTTTFPWEGSSDIQIPILLQATHQFAARAFPELVRGDKIVQARVFSPVSKQPSTQALAQAAMPPQHVIQSAAQQDPQGVQQVAQQAAFDLQDDQRKDNLEELAVQAQDSQGARLAQYLNWKLFYDSDGEWVDDTDLLLNQIPITGCGFKKVYMSPDGLKSDYVSPMHLTVNNHTKSMARCRITYDYMMQPIEIEEKMRAGFFRDVDLNTDDTEDDQEPRKLIEQLTYRDLDDDGLPEPYFITVDVETEKVLRIEPAYGAKDIKINTKKHKIVSIKRWNPYADFKFFPDPRGNFYGTGFAKLLGPISDSIDTSINQLMDAGTAQIAGGGFIASNIRLPGSGQGGSLWFQPAEYKVVNTNGAELKDGIYERPLPQPSDVTMQMLNVLMTFAKDIASIKDVATGDSSTMAPVGTTLAVQGQALQVFASIYQRLHQGFQKEFRLLYECLKTFRTDRERREYAKITGGDLDQDMDNGDFSEIELVSDPSVVTQLQRFARIHAIQQYAESPSGQAAGMLQPGPAQAMAMEVLQAIGVDRPERFIAAVPPNPMQMAEAQAKTQDIQATAQLKTQQAQKVQADIAKTAADISLIHTKTLRESGLATLDTDEIDKKADGTHPDDMLSDAQINKINSDTSLNHAKTVREVGLVHKDAMSSDEGLMQ